jgi:hypothetical protein
LSEEASANLGVFRSAENLPKPYSDELRAVAVRYARVVIDNEWPTMAKGGQPTEGGLVIAAMWAVSTDMLKALPAESTAAVSVRTAIRLLQDDRERRKEQYRSRLSPIMWAHKRRSARGRNFMSLGKRTVTASLLPRTLYQLLDLADADRGVRPCPAF